MNYSDVLNNARQRRIGKYCKACPVCNGVAEKPGPVPRWATQPSAIIIVGVGHPG